MNQDEVLALQRTVGNSALATEFQNSNTAASSSTPETNVRLPPHSDPNSFIQRASTTINQIQPGINFAATKKIQKFLRERIFSAPVSLPAAEAPTTRARSKQKAPENAAITFEEERPRARISHRSVLQGGVISLPHKNVIATVRTESAQVYGAALGDIDEWLQTTNSKDNPEVHSFAIKLKNWLGKKRASHGGDLHVTSTAVSDSATTVSISGRPEWTDTANEILTNDKQDRRHIIAWHTIRSAFENVLNEALRNMPDHDIQDRIKKIIETLDKFGGASTEEATLHDLLNASITRMLNSLNSNPYNLWAGDSVTNQSINRVRTQISSLYRTHENDSELLLKSVQQKAEEGTEKRTQDTKVWTEVRDLLKGSEPEESKSIVHFIMDSLDVDIPYLGKDDAPSTTYVTERNQRAVTKHVLSTRLAHDALAMADGGNKQRTFDQLLDLIRNWMSQFMHPSNLATTLRSGARRVEAKR